MKLIGILPCRNEDWVLALSARVALQWCDEIVMLVHASTDRTEEIASEITREFPGRAWMAVQDDPKWAEMEHRQALLMGARDHGATHVAIIDADEILTGNLIGSIRGHIEKAPKGWMTFLPGYNLRGGLDRYHSTGIWSDRLFSVAFPDDKRLYWGGDQFHHREPMGASMGQWRPVHQGAGGVMHLWGASERRLVAKHALYKITETLRWPNRNRAHIDRMYNQAFDPKAEPAFDQDWQYAAVPTEWWEPYTGLMHYLDVDAEPWQEAACRRLIEQHGAVRFQGLDLFGMAELPVGVY